jgi:putative phosphoribosyl transferase
MYFASRMQAGRMLATQIAAKYGNQECVVVALSDGGVVVGSQIALALHAPLCMILSAEIILPRELSAFAGITQNGSFSYNHAMSSGEIDEMVGEYRGHIEAQKLEKLHKLHRDSGGGDLIRDDILDDRNIILVSDGLSSGFALDLAMEYLKPVKSKSVIMAAPFASVQAVDRMHVLANDLFCLNVQEDFISVDHYYDTQDVPNHELVLKTVARIVADWKPTPKASAMLGGQAGSLTMVQIPDVSNAPLAPAPSGAIDLPESAPGNEKRRFRIPKPHLHFGRLLPPKMRGPIRRLFTVNNRANGSNQSK